MPGGVGGARSGILIAPNPIGLSKIDELRFIFTDPPVLKHLPADGSVWWVDTTKEHSAMNGSLIDRIHLVMCLVNTSEE